MHNKTLSVSSMEMMGVYLMRSGFSHLHLYSVCPVKMLKGVTYFSSIIAWGKHGILTNTKLIVLKYSVHICYLV